MHGGFVAKNVVTQRRGAHGVPHGVGGLRDGVGAKVGDELVRVEVHAHTLGEEVHRREELGNLKWKHCEGLGNIYNMLDI